MGSDSSPGNMWSSTPLSVALVCIFVTASLSAPQEDQLAESASNTVTSSLPEPSSSAASPSSSSSPSTPLALLLATAKASKPPVPLLPLAPSGSRIKRKPSSLLSSRFQPKERKKFRPKGKIQVKEEEEKEVEEDEEDDDEEKINEISVEPVEKNEAVPVKKKFLPSKATKKPSSRFAAFNRRPRPGPVKFDFKKKAEEKRRKEEKRKEEERKRKEKAAMEKEKKKEEEKMVEEMKVDEEMEKDDEEMSTTMQERMTTPLQAETVTMTTGLDLDDTAETVRTTERLEERTTERLKENKNREIEKHGQRRHKDRESGKHHERRDRDRDNERHDRDTERRDREKERRDRDTERKHRDRDVERRDRERLIERHDERRVIETAERHHERRDRDSETTERYETERRPVSLLAARIPLAISNDLRSASSSSLLDVVRTQTSKLTGATALGVTRDVVRQEGGRREQRQLSLPDRRQEEEQEVGREELVRARSRVGARRDNQASPRREEQVFRGQVEEEEERIEEREETEVRGNLVTAPAPTRRRKSNRKFHKKKKAFQKNGRKHGTRQGRINTVHSYRVTNDDGSITWGYESEDGSFKEETIGVDCVTHGKYGYIDPTGELREYSYTSGNRCDPHTRKQVGGDQSKSKKSGFFDYAQNKFVRADGRRVTVVVNQE